MLSFKAHLLTFTHGRQFLNWGKGILLFNIFSTKASLSLNVLSPKWLSPPPPETGAQAPVRTRGHTHLHAPAYTPLRVTRLRDLWASPARITVRCRSSPLFGGHPPPPRTNPDLTVIYGPREHWAGAWPAGGGGLP